MSDRHKVMPLEGHDISWGELPFWAIWSMCLVLGCVPIWRVHRSKAKPANGPHIVQAPSPYSLRTIASLTFVEGSLCGDPEAMRWEQGVCFAIFHVFMCPLGK